MNTSLSWKTYPAVQGSLYKVLGKMESMALELFAPCCSNSLEAYHSLVVSPALCDYSPDVEG